MLEKHSYCVRCHGEKTVIGAAPAIFRNGSVAVKGKCPSCEGEVYKIVNKDAIQLKPNAARQMKLLYAFSFVLIASGLALGLALAYVL